jgi:hypothetical protein
MNSSMKGKSFMERTFLIFGMIMAVLFGLNIAMAADECQDVTATNRQHAWAGRAYYTLASGDADAGYYVVGSEDYIGRRGMNTTTLFTTDGGRSYYIGDCSWAPDDDHDADGYTADVDCDDGDPYTYPGAMDFCGDGIDQDCSGADSQCLPPPSCIPDLTNWKRRGKP